MIKHAIKSCPRCGNDFECKTSAIALCQCQGVRLSPEQLNYIGGLYGDCLCATCLGELRTGYDSSCYEREKNSCPVGIDS